MSAEKPHCRANTKAGKPCGAAPTSGGLCFFHSNPAKASELGRIGGRRNRQLHIQDSLLLDSGAADSLRDKLASLSDLVLNRKLQPAQATVILKIIKLQLDLDEKTDISELEQRLDELNRVIAMRDIEAAKLEDPFSGEENPEDSFAENEDDQKQH
jgi:hypothetical protein